MKTLRVGLDLDGLFLDFNQAYRDLIKQEYNVDVQYPPQEWAYDQRKLNREQINHLCSIIGTTDFWVKVPPYEWTKDFMERLRLTHHEVYFITSRSGRHVKDDCETSLTNCGFPCPTILPVSGPQYKLPIIEALKLHLYVDDKIETVEEIYSKARKTHVMIFDQPWNQKNLNRGIQRIYKVGEILDWINREEQR